MNTYNGNVTGNYTNNNQGNYQSNYQGNQSIKTVEQFSWKGFASRAVLVVIFVLLLSWLLPMPNTKELEGKVDNLSASVSVITDRIFNQNINDMKNAAKDYFTIKRLPKNVNEKVKISLKDMIDKKLLLNVLDKKGNACNYDSSYVEITRLDKEYEMKTYLSCDGASDYILSYMDLECNLSCNNECALVEKETPKPNNKGQTTKNYIYKFKKVETKQEWTDWSAWTTEIKQADDKKEKIQYKGKKWVSVPVYKYEHTKTVEGENECVDVIVPGGEKCETITVPAVTKKEWVNGQTKQCPEQQPYYDTETHTSYRTESYTDQECKTVRYKTGSSWVKKCKTCGYTKVDNYATKTECKPVTKTRTVPYTYQTQVLKYRTIYKDCSTEGYYKDVIVTPEHTEEKCTKLPDTTKKECTQGESKTITIWTFNEHEEGYTATGKKEYVRDDGYYIYTDWVSEIPAGYEMTETRKLYSYRYLKITTNVRYTWSKNKSLGDGWELIETKEVNM